MKAIFARGLGIVLISTLQLVNSLAAESPTMPDSSVLKTQKDKVSYGMGVNIAKSFKQQQIDVEPEVLARGMKDILTGQNTLLSEQEINDTMTAFQDEMRQKQAQASKAAGEENKKAGEAFLAANKAKPGVTTLPNGLQYKVIKQGTGKKPAITDTVECHYRGTLINGTEFDSSYKRGQPATFPVNGVIAGWKEALQLMPSGSKWELYVPSELGYGARGAGPQIGPNATLVFEVELVSIK